MAVPLRILLILALITGIHSIKTVRQVSVKAGAPVTIPCLYEAKYRNNVKYLCKGYTWASCSYEIKTNTPQNSQKYSISDDKTQTIFTVTIQELADKNTFYWCFVELELGADVGEQFYLSETAGPPSLYVDNQEVTGFIEENITINCNYNSSGEMKWCKMGSNCVTNQSGLIDGTRVTLNTSINNVFSVTLSELRQESSGWYYCVKGDFQMPVHLTVTEKPTVASVHLKSFMIRLSLLILFGFVVLVVLGTLSKSEVYMYLCSTSVF
ncbi:CMRF35-like molecule 8 [Kryptolebias marmoratus]|uniref:CMRF35-like molecule 8 n=1 Tax=Kryptolebias marmoratus TaxID=37003 RepID=UPI0018ACF977|nr:CMRF35-like molecule 8 [Kryptolebias marmoratus]